MTWDLAAQLPTDVIFMIKCCRH